MYLLPKPFIAAALLLAATLACAQPANDDCANAALVYPNAGSECYTNIYGSTFDAALAGPDCSASNTVRDVWYQFVAGSPDYIVQLFPYLGSGIFGFEVLEGSCGALNAVFCASGSGVSRQIVSGLTIGATYFIRVYSGSSESGLEFYGCISTWPPPPANDACSSATALTVNENTFCNTTTPGMTTGATNSEEGCNGAAGVHDVWYSFVATAPTHRVEVNLSYFATGSYENLGYEVYSGECGSLTSLTCKEHYYTPAILTDLTPGETYYLRVYSTYATSHGFTVCIQTLPLPPANTSCAEAVNLTPASGAFCDTPTGGSTAGIETPITGTCYYAGGMSVWYAFTAVSPNHVLRISNPQYLYGPSSAYWVEILTGPDCNNLNIINCYQNAAIEYLTNLTVGQTYYIHFQSIEYSAHTFDICIGTLPVLTNDECSNAMAVSVDPDNTCDVPASFTTAGATTGQNTGCLYTADAWFQFTATEKAHSIRLGNVTNFEYGYPQEANAELLSGDCGHLTSLRCWTSSVFSNETIVVGELLPGQTYYLRVASPFYIPINFDLCITTPPQPPANDACIDAIALQVDAPICGGTVAGTTQNATASNSQTPPCCGNGDVWYSFVATQSTHVIGVYSITNPANGYLEAAQVTLYGGCQPGAALEGTNSGYNEISLLATHLTPGATYYIQVAGSSYYTPPAVNFEICVSAPEAPANDECSGALPMPVNEDLSCNIALSGNTFGATPSTEAGCYFPQVTDIWYQFTATSASYKIDLSATGPYGEWGYQFLGGACETLTSIRCEGPYSPPSFTLSNLTIGETYYLRLFSNRNRSHEFYVCARVLPPPPANDHCAGAAPIPVNPDMTCTNVVQGSTLGAQPSAQLSCNNYFNNDVWYTFTAAGASQLFRFITISGYFYSDYHMGFQLYSGDCNNLNSLTCQEYAYANSNFILGGLNPGQTYYLRIFSGNDGAHDFSFCLQTLPPPPPNDDCAQATPVTPNPGLNCEQVYPGTTLSATGGGWYFQDVWYTFTASSTGYIFDFQPITAILGSEYNLQFEIYQGADCNNLTIIAGNSALYSTIYQNMFTPGQTYYIRVFTNDLNAAQNFNLCIRTIPPSPPNESCSGAFEVTPNTGLECSTVLSGTTAGAIDYGYSSGCGYGYDVWYKFTAITSTHQVQLTNINPLVNNGGINLEVVQSADCISFNSLSCTYSDQPAFLTGLNPGETYYIRVTSEWSSVYNYDICIKTIQPPANDECANAAPIALDPEPYCTVYTAGTTLGANSSALSPCSYNGNDVWYSFTATQSAHSITVADAIDALYGYGANFGIEVYDGTCENLNNLYCRQNLYISDYSVVGELTAGETYYVRIIAYYSNINFNICFGTPPAPPSNDGCAGATILTTDPDEMCDNPTAGTTVNATVSPGIPYYGYPSSNYDVWYAFTATQNNHIINISDLTNPDGGYNALVVDLNAGTCGAFSSSVQYYFYNSGQALVTNLNPGTIYYLRIYDQYNQKANFNICITSPPPPANDLCENAQPIPVNPGITCENFVAGSTYGATPSSLNCPQGPYNDVWYQFVAQSVNHRLDVTITGGTYYVFGMDVREGSCGQQTVVLPCSEYYSGSSPVTLQNLTVGQTYYVRIYTYANFYLTFNLCLRTLPPPPGNDDCETAINLPVNSDLNCDQFLNGTTLGATGQENSCYGVPSQDVWYQFIATNDRHLVQFNVTDYLLEPYGVAGLSVYAGECGNLSQIYCADNLTNTGIPLNGLQIGATYHVRVYSYLNAAHHFTLCVGTIPPPPANDLCSAAFEVKPKNNLNCNQATAGTTAGLTDYNYQGCNYGPDVWYWFEATGPVHLIQFSDINLLYGSDFMGLELYRGNNCEVLELLACGNGSIPIYAANLVQGEKYYVRVIGNEASAVEFDLCISKINPPSNDLCANAISLTPASSTSCQKPKSGTTLGAGASAAQGDCGLVMDVWYSFVASSTTHQVNITNIYAYLGYSTLFYEVYSGSCGSLTSLGCFYTYYPPGPIENLTIGQKYYIRVGSSDLLPVSFNICVTTPRPDLSIFQVSTPSNGCGSGSNEPVEILVTNYGQATVPTGAASFTLTITGANAGQYGPVTNPSPVYAGSSQLITIPGVNLSNTGNSTLKARVTLSGDANPSNNNLDVPFTVLPLLTLYADLDGDGYGNPDNAIQTCNPPGSPWVAQGGDCNDSDPAIHPGAEERCDNADNDCNGVIDDCILISGTIRWEHNNAGVKLVTVNLSGDDTGSDTTGASGFYQFEHLSGQNFGLQPQKNLNLLNGVTVADANLVRRKAQGQNVLNTPYKLIAADVDKNNAITMADYNLLLQTINNPNGANVFSPSWRFVPAAHTFPNPQAPWGFPETISLSNVSSDQVNQDFVGVKLGDVNGSGNPAQKPGTNATPLVWQVSDRLLQAGETITAEFQAAAYNNLAAWQFALQFDPEYLEWNNVEGLEPLALNAAHFGASRIQEGILIAIWDNDNEQTLPPGAGVFRLQFQVLRSGVLLSDVLRISEKTMPAEAYNLDLAAAPVKLVFTQALQQETAGASGKLQLFQNQPNPFVQQTRIGFILPEACEATLSVYDTEGRALWQEKRHYPAGYQERTVRLEALAPAGMLYYELTTPYGVLSRKMARMMP